MKTLHPKISKIILKVLTLIMVTLVISSCQKPQKPEKPQGANDEETRDSILQVAIENLMKNNIISLEEAIEMRNKYISQRIKPFEKQLEKMYGDTSFKETKTIWFDIATIRTYLDFLNKKAANAEGLQFYFSVATNGDSNNHQTFFIAPTKTNGKKQSGFTIVNGEQVFLNTKFNADNLSQQSQKAGFLNFSTSLQEESLLLNRGGGSPPNNND